MFLDEPMSGLDPVGRKEIRDLIVRLNAEGKTVFMNTHILSDVEMICDRVAIIVGGRIAYEGALEAFERERKLFDVTLAGLPADFAEEVEARSARRSADAAIASAAGRREGAERAAAGGARARRARRGAGAPHREDLEALVHAGCRGAAERGAA